MNVIQISYISLKALKNQLIYNYIQNNNEKTILFIT